MDYEKYIKRCLELAQRGEYWVAPNPMVGAVLVHVQRDNVQSTKEEIIAEGWHERFGEGHAEVNCFRNAENKLQRDNIQCAKDFYKECTLFVLHLHVDGEELSSFLRRQFCLVGDKFLQLGIEFLWRELLLILCTHTHGEHH
jgi:hypothetical protein